jgi:hypothetical protein
MQLKVTVPSNCIERIGDVLIAKLNSVESTRTTIWIAYRIVIWTATRTALNGRDLSVDREQLAPFNAVARRPGEAAREIESTAHVRLLMLPSQIGGSVLN